jgi:hypothetical protein
VAVKRDQSQVAGTGRKGTMLEHVLCSAWLEEMLRDCIDPDRLGIEERFVTGRQPSAAMTASAFVTTETFCSAKLIEALCQSAFIVEQQSSGTIMK